MDYLIKGVYNIVLRHSIPTFKRFPRSSCVCCYETPWTIVNRVGARKVYRIKFVAGSRCWIFCGDK